VFIKALLMRTIGCPSLCRGFVVLPCFWRHWVNRKFFKDTISPPPDLQTLCLACRIIHPVRAGSARSNRRGHIRKQTLPRCFNRFISVTKPHTTENPIGVYWI